MVRDRVVTTFRLNTNDTQCVALRQPDEVRYRVRLMGQRQEYTSDYVQVGEEQAAWLEIDHRPSGPLLWTLLRSVDRRPRS